MSALEQYNRIYASLARARSHGVQRGKVGHDKDAEIAAINETIVGLEALRADLLGPHAEDFPGKDVRGDTPDERQPA